MEFRLETELYDTVYIVCTVRVLHKLSSYSYYSSYDRYYVHGYDNDYSQRCSS